MPLKNSKINLLNQFLLFRRSFPWTNLFKLSRLSKSTVFEKYLGKNWPSKIYGSQHLKNLKLFKGCLPQILLSLFLNTLFHLLFWIISIHSKMRVLIIIEAIRKFFSATKNSPFRLMSLIYAEKFEFENPAIMEDKQCKQTKRFSVMTKGRDYFLS